LAQIKALFEKQWESIMGNCDEFLYLGGNEQGTHKYVSELLGKATIDMNTYGKSTGHSGNYSTNYQLSGRELMTPDEVKNMPNEKQIVFVRGMNPVFDDKCYWFKEKEFKKYLDYPKFRFKAVPKLQMEMLNDSSVDYLKNDSSVELYLYNCTFAELAMLDIEGTGSIDMESFNSQIESFREGMKNRKRKTDISDDMSLEELVVNTDLTAEQLSCLADAALAGVSEEILKKLVLTDAEPERIALISKL
jgi:hypothetical protein